MKILVKPSDLVKLCLYDNFTTYVIGNTEKANALLEEDQEFELKHNDALVIGLLKVIETDHLIFKFNDFFHHILMTKSINIGGVAHINKSIVDRVIEKFLAKFPARWKMEANYAKRYNDLLEYLEDIKQVIESLEYKQIQVKNKKYDAYKSIDINKALKFIHY